MSRNRTIIIGAVIIVIGIVITFPFWSPYFINQTVDEDFPFSEMTEEQREEFASMPEEQQLTLIEMSEDNMEMASDTAIAMMEDDTVMAEDMPEDMPEEPVVLSTGTFNEFDPVHAGEGTATIYELPDGSRVLRLEDFRVTNGPQLHVILAANNPGSILESLDEGYVDLGPLKGNVGNQNYEIPDDVDLETLTNVIIYCVPFSVNFSVAATS